MPNEGALQNVLQRDPGPIIGNQIAALTGAPAIVTLERQREWASITFSGIRYRFLIEWEATDESSASRNLAQRLPDHEFFIPNYFVADILIREQSELRLRVEILAIIDPVANRSGG